MNEVLQNRLVSSKIPSEFTKIKIADGKVVVGVDNEFEVRKLRFCYYFVSSS